MLFSYLRRHYKIILMILLFIAVFAGVFSLYELPVEAILYSALLCVFFGVIFFGFGFAAYLRRHRELRGMLANITLTLDMLPVPKGALEEDYQELLQALFAEKCRVEAHAARDRREAVDYYTMWAHQIKTPIAAMRLLLQEQPEQNAALDAELFSIEQYVGMVLTYLRVDSESSDLVLRECSLDNIIRQALRKFARLFISKKLSLDFRETNLTVLTDEKWLLFVIEQLLSNSLKYTRQGLISIFADGYELVIADTGIGVRADDLPRVFDKGFTGYNGREDKKSTGLGLYLCRRVCALLGHSIRMESEAGRWTRVIIDLRARDMLLE